MSWRKAGTSLRNSRINTQIMADVNYKKINVIQEGLVLVDFGPVTMTLEARRNGTSFTEAAFAGANKVLEVFDDLTAHLDKIRKPLRCIGFLPQNIPLVCRKMTESVSLLAESDFTPMAAVAGTVSDLAVDAMIAHGADYAIANNGGDIAWRLPTDRSQDFRIGLISDIETGKISHKLEISSSSAIHGLATSGMGGRSLTRGIASAVTVLAETSSKADAAATAIANACICNDPAIGQCLAEELDYLTDIQGLLVTRSVGVLSEESIQAALEAGRTRGEELINKGMILGAILFVQGRMFRLEAGQRDSLFLLSELD